MVNRSQLLLAISVACAAPAYSETALEPVTVEVDATSATASTYLSFEEGVLTSGLEAKEGWQIAVKRTQFQTNSGTSGEGSVGVYNTEVKDFSTVTSCSPGTLSYDELLPASGAPGSLPYSGNAVLNAWYDYDMTLHRVTSKKDVYLIVSEDSCYKLQILDYKSGRFVMQAEALEKEPSEEVETPTEQVIDASSSTASALLTLAEGSLVPSTIDDNWWLSVKRTSFQTNSGTSGEGSVTVADSGLTDFAALTSCEGLTFEADSIVPASGAPGSVASSGNAVLNAWYNYDISTHQVSSKQLVYAISNGEECVKFQILDYKSGRFTVKYQLVK